MQKILHIADLHLDSPMKRLSYSRAKEFKDRMRSVFSTAVDFAKEQKCSAVLLSGDLFDTEFYSRETLELLSREFARASEIKFIIAPGNHDPYTPSSPYSNFKFPDNVFIFSSGEISKFEFPELNLTVYGYAFTSHSYTARPLSGFSAEGEGYHVLCAHADTDSPLSTYAPISARELEGSGLDYAGLGHIHTKVDIFRFGDTLCAYSGCIAGRDFSEQGEKGGVLVTLDTVGGRRLALAERVRFCPWEYAELEADITKVTENQLSDYLKGETERVISENSPKELVLQIKLCGFVPYLPDCKALSEELSCFGVTSVVNQAVLLPPSGLENDYTVRGELYRQLKPYLESADSRERERGALALKLGLSALEGTL